MSLITFNLGCLVLPVPPSLHQAARGPFKTRKQVLSFLYYSNPLIDLISLRVKTKTSGPGPFLTNLDLLLLTLPHPQALPPKLTRHTLAAGLCLLFPLFLLIFFKSLQVIDGKTLPPHSIDHRAASSSLPCQVLEHSSPQHPHQTCVCESIHCPCPSPSAPVGAKLQKSRNLTVSRSHSCTPCTAGRMNVCRQRTTP